jgi:hypothetical protein
MYKPLERGFRSGHLTVVSQVEGKKGQYHCACDCGGTKVVRGYRLRSESVTSCGCKRFGTQPERHGHKTTNKYLVIDENITLVYATNTNTSFIISTSDLKSVIKHTWAENIKTGYMSSTIDGNPTLLHRYILNLGNSSLWGDHLNRNKRVYTRDNLRAVSPKENAANQGEAEVFYYKGVDLLAENVDLAPLLSKTVAC